MNLLQATTTTFVHDYVVSKMPSLIPENTVGGSKRKSNHTRAANVPSPKKLCQDNRDPQELRKASQPDHQDSDYSGRAVNQLESGQEVIDSGEVDAHAQPLHATADQSARPRSPLRYRFKATDFDTILGDPSDRETQGRL